MSDETMGDWKTRGGSGDAGAEEERGNWTFGDAATSGRDGRVVLAGRYRVERRLGEGGMGSVWLAEDAKLDGRKVAVKMLPSVLAGKKGAYRQVKAEALMAMKLSHPNIATVRGFEEDEGGNPFLVMDYIDGEPLDEILAERGLLGEEETRRILGPVAAALDYAHSQGVVHRDVKPGNVMVRKDGTPFVLDFGIAREVQETMTRVTGKMSSGTLLYMSPEQLNGDAPKAAQDVYSFAAMAYECLAGHAPFFRGGIEDQIKHKMPEPLPENVDEALRAGVADGLAKAAGERPGTCAGVLGRDEAERREREKRAAEEAKRLRQEAVRRLQERARAEAEQRQREEALEAERQARAMAEAKAEKARRQSVELAQAAALAREAHARASGWALAFGIFLALGGLAGFAWWSQVHDQQDRSQRELWTTKKQLEDFRQQAETWQKKAESKLDPATIPPAASSAKGFEKASPSPSVASRKASRAPRLAKPTENAGTKVLAKFRENQGKTAPEQIARGKKEQAENLATTASRCMDRTEEFKSQLIKKIESNPFKKWGEGMEFKFRVYINNDGKIYKVEFVLPSGHQEADKVIQEALDSMLGVRLTTGNGEETLVCTLKTKLRRGQ